MDGKIHAERFTAALDRALEYRTSELFSKLEVDYWEHPEDSDNWYAVVNINFKETGEKFNLSAGPITNYEQDKKYTPDIERAAKIVKAKLIKMYYKHTLAGQKESEERYGSRIRELEREIELVQEMLRVVKRKAGLDDE